MNSLTYHFDLICHLVWRDFSLRYKRSVLGIFWSFILPLAQLIVLTFLFRKVIPLDIDNYPAFVFSGLLPWTWFNACLNSSGILFISNRDLIRRPNFTPAILIMVNALSNLINYLIAMPILFALLVLSGKTVTLALLYLPVLVLIQGILIVGLGLFISTLNVFYRDIQPIMGVALTLLFYVTPVFYQSQTVGEKYRILYELNPIAVLIQGYQSIFFYGVVPQWNLLLLTSVISGVMCVIGYLIYRHYLHDIIDCL